MSSEAGVMEPGRAELSIHASEVTTQQTPGCEQEQPAVTCGLHVPSLPSTTLPPSVLKAKQLHPAFMGRPLLMNSNTSPLHS